MCVVKVRVGMERKETLCAPPRVGGGSHFGQTKWLSASALEKWQFSSCFLSLLKARGSCWPLDPCRGMPHSTAKWFVSMERDLVGDPFRVGTRVCERAKKEGVLPQKGGRRLL